MKDLIAEIAIAFHMEGNVASWAEAQEMATKLVAATPLLGVLYEAIGPRTAALAAMSLRLQAQRMLAN